MSVDASENTKNTIQQLSDLWKVTSPTIARDLDALKNLGVLVREVSDKEEKYLIIKYENE